MEWWNGHVDGDASSQTLENNARRVKWEGKEAESVDK